MPVTPIVARLIVMECGAPGYSVGPHAKIGMRFVATNPRPSAPALKPLLKPGLRDTIVRRNDELTVRSAESTGDLRGEQLAQAMNRIVEFDWHARS